MQNHIALAETVAQQIAERADDADKQGRLPPEDVQALRESGYLRLSVPQEYGGYGLSLRECVAAQMALAQGSGSTAIVAGMQLHVFGHMAETHPWSTETEARLCEAAVAGGLFNFVATEPKMGSPSRGGLPATEACPTEAGWRVNGHKTWVSGGQQLTHLLVRLHIDDDPADMLILRDTPGIEWVKTWQHTLSMRATDSHDVHFNDVLVPPDHLLTRGKPETPRPNVWFPMIMAAIYLGEAIAARNTLIQYALERVPTALGQPIATLPKIQRQIGEIDVALQAARALMFAATAAWTGRAEDVAGQYPQLIAAKTHAVAVANEVTQKALQVAGGSSLTRELPLERFFRDVRAGEMQPPSGDTAFELVGRQAIYG